MIQTGQSRPGEWQTGLFGTVSVILLARVIACAMLLAFSSPAQAQQPKKIAKIAFIGVRPEAANYSAKSVLYELQQLGYVEGKTFTFEARSADNHVDRLPGIIDELIRLKLDVLITAATRELHVAKNATRDLPIVSLNLGDPIASGLVQSLARPGGNITGFTPLSGELTSKRLALLKETAPGVSHAAVLIHPLVTSAVAWKQSWEESERVARRLGIEIRSFEINAEAELAGTFKQILSARANGLVVTLSPLINSLQRKIVDLAVTHKLPAIYPRGDFAESGGLISYGADRNEPYARVAVMVDKILKGVKPADIPVEQASKFELICNLRGAKQIGLTISPNVLARADRVIK